MEDENSFCVACGATLPKGAGYCTECGAPMGEANPYRADSNPSYAPRSRDRSDMKMFILIYGIIAALMSILFLWISLSLDEATWNELSSLYKEMGMGSYAPWDNSIPITMIVPRAFTLLSGLCTLGSW